jgi:hypothetical protein
MPPAKLTKTYLDRLQPGPADVIHWDTELKGFGVKVTPAGKRVFLVQYRPAGRAGNPRKYTIGPFGSFTVEQARTQAQRITAAKAMGKDPQEEKRAQRDKLTSDRFRDLLDRFLAQHAAKRRTGDETKRILEGSSHRIGPARASMT